MPPPSPCPPGGSPLTFVLTLLGHVTCKLMLFKNIDDSNDMHTIVSCQEYSFIQVGLDVCLSRNYQSTKATETQSCVV